MSTGADLEAAIGRARNGDGGYGPSPGAESEPEPTAMAALALADSSAADWLAARQSSDGAIALHRGDVVNHSATALAAWSLTGDARERALDSIELARAAPFPTDDLVELDGTQRGWPFVTGTAAWVDPTCRALLALRRFRPDSALIEASVGFLADRACRGGGWNYGNRTVYGTDLDPYVHTTALACLALDGDLAPELLDSGLSLLEQRWSTESGVLSLALALAALRLNARRISSDVADELHRCFATTGAFGDTVAICWAAIASSDRLWDLAP